MPGGGDGHSSGRPDRAALLARAAVAAGVHVVFIECHPRPAEAFSDATTCQPLDKLDLLLQSLASIRGCVSRPTADRTDGPVAGHDLPTMS